MKYISNAKSEGATILYGGSRPEVKQCSFFSSLFIQYTGCIKLIESYVNLKFYGKPLMATFFWVFGKPLIVVR